MSGRVGRGGGVGTTAGIEDDWGLGGAVEAGLGGGRLEGMKGEEETGIWARGGLGGLAARTVAGDALIRFSISSISDWDDG